MRYNISPTNDIRAGICPHCSERCDLVVMRPESAAPLAMKAEQLLQCPDCGKLSVPATLSKRLIALSVLIPFALLLAAAFFGGAYLVMLMVVEGMFSGAFALVAALLCAASSFGMYKTWPAIARLVRRNALLPLVTDANGEHVFAGQV